MNKELTHIETVFLIQAVAEYAIKSVVRFIAVLISFLLSPLFVLLANERDGWINNRDHEPNRGIEPRLPTWLWPFMTNDNSLLGDIGHKERWQGKRRYIQMVAWLWRNPMSGLADYFGKSVSDETAYFVAGNMDYDRNNGNGWYFIFTLKPVAFEIRGRIGAPRKITFGWDLRQYAQNGANGYKDNLARLT